MFLWSFSDVVDVSYNQIDIDVNHPAGREYLLSILDRFASAGVRAIRLDAAGYAIKKRGTSCFMKLS